LPGFILRQTPYRNADGILEVLTPEGFLTVQARGMLKMTSPFQAVTSLGSWAEMTLSVSKSKHFLEKASLIKFAPLPEKEGLLSSMMMQVALQILLLNDSKLESPQLYPLLVNLRTQDHDPIWTWLKFLTSYASLQGVPMVIDYCVACQSKEKIVSISTKLGGFICQSCLATSDAEPYPALSLSRLRQLHKQSAIIGVDQDYLSLVTIIHHHLEFHLDSKIVGLQTLQKLITKIHS
jgi:DNA repair protein RecO (recombination protein O)